MTPPFDSSPGASSRPAPGEGPTLAEEHWRIAADAVTAHRGEALQVAAVARAIADAEQRGRAAGLVAAFAVACQGGEEQHDLHVRYCVPLAEAAGEAHSEIAEGSCGTPAVVFDVEPFHG